MFELIDDYKKASPKFIVPQGEYVFKKLRLLRNRLRSYWLSSASAVRSEHSLVTALVAFSAIAKDATSVYFIAKEQSETIAKSLGWVSESGFGRCRAMGDFYYGMKEIIIHTEDENTLTMLNEYLSGEDPYAYLLWEPVTVRRHPFTDMSMELPSSLFYKKKVLQGYADEVCEIEVDLTKLCLQYWIWKSRPESLFDIEERPQDEEYISAFIKRIVLPNMLKSHLDVAYFNRLVCKLQGKEVDNDKLNDRMSFGNPYMHLDDNLDFILDKLSGVTLDVNLILNTVKLPSGKTLGEFYKLYTPIRVHQNKLALGYSIFQLYQFVFELMAKNNEVKRAKRFANDFKWANRAWRGGGILKTIRGIKPEDSTKILDNIAEYAFR